MYGMKKKHVCFLCTVDKSKFNTTYRSVEYLLPPVTVQDIMPPRHKKNEHTLDNLCGKCPMIVPVFSQSQHIDLERYVVL